MRTPECTTYQAEWRREKLGDLLKPDGCCGTCIIQGKNVDVYYWPEPDADTSCLSIVGTDVQPIDYGATSLRCLGKKYWGCTTLVPGSSISTITTAVIDHRSMWGGLPLKTYLVHPYSSQPCPEITPVPLKSSKTYAAWPPLTKTNYSLGISSTASWHAGSRASTMVSGNFTL